MNALAIIAKSSSSAAGPMATPGTRDNVGEPARTRALFALVYLVVAGIQGSLLSAFWHTPDSVTASLAAGWCIALIRAAVWWMVMVLVDSAMPTRVSSWVSYVVAVLVTGTVTPMLELLATHLLLDTPYLPPLMESAWQYGFFAVWYAAMLTAACRYRLSVLERTTSLRAARLDRAVATRTATESRLQAMQGASTPDCCWTH